MLAKTVLSAGLVLLTIAFCGALAHAEDDAETKALLKKRSELLDKARDLYVRGVKEFRRRAGDAPIVSLVELCQVQRDALNAKLDLCTNTAERIVALRQSLTIADQAAKDVLELPPGLLPQAGEGVVQAFAVEVRIQLRREEARQAK